MRLAPGGLAPGGLAPGGLIEAGPSGGEVARHSGERGCPATGDGGPPVTAGHR